MPPIPCTVTHSTVSWALDSRAVSLRYRDAEQQLAARRLKKEHRPIYNCNGDDCGRDLCGNSTAGYDQQRVGPQTLTHVGPHVGPAGDPGPRVGSGAEGHRHVHRRRGQAQTPAGNLLLQQPLGVSRSVREHPEVQRRFGETPAASDAWEKR